MAVSFSNNFSFYFPPFSSPSSSSSTTPSKFHQPNFRNLLSLKLQPQHHRGAHVSSTKPCFLGFSLSNSSHFPDSNCRRSFKSNFALQDSASQTNNEDEGISNDSNMNRADDTETSSMKTLIAAYKKAVLDGDEKTISEVEAMICMVEIEKNNLVQKLSTFSAEINSGKEKYIRLQADFDNFRKRSENERLTVRNRAQEEVIESLLAMVDSFERAKQQIKPETEKEKKIDTSYQGIYKQFVEIMRSLRVAAVPTIGKPFDPSLHEAIAREESKEFKEGFVCEEFRRGFLLGDRLLRPAMVKVSTGLSKNKPTQKSTGEPATAAGLDER
ncbi:hypothetical protein NMG60_11017466 [Bertholletia excelsa]